jgi:hypothetical protein
MLLLGWDFRGSYIFGGYFLGYYFLGYNFLGYYFGGYYFLGDGSFLTYYGLGGDVFELGFTPKSP